MTGSTADPTDAASADLPVGVVGVGRMGSIHARAYSRIAGARLVGVVDLDTSRSASVAAELGTKAMPELATLAGAARAVTVAVPTAEHHRVTRELLLAGVDVLVEKPLAATLDEARDLVAIAAARGRRLMVGHTERFNPVIRAMASIIRRPGFVEVHRLAPFTERGTDVDVVLDLMIHDLDLLLHFVRSEVVAVDAVGVPVLTSRADIANARIRFASGTVANLTASRVSLERMRKVRFFEPDLYVSLDTANRSAKAFRLVKGDGPPRIETLDLGEVPADDPIESELSGFLAAVRAGVEPPVPGADGLRAMELAERVRAAIATPS